MIVSSIDESVDPTWMPIEGIERSGDDLAAGGSYQLQRGELMETRGQDPASDIVSSE
jgi:hypothetical protein